MKKKIAVTALLLIAFFLAFMTSQEENDVYYERYKQYKYGFFPDYSSIRTPCSERDREKALDIMYSAEENLRKINPTGEDTFSPYTFVGEDIIEKTKLIHCGIELITARFSFSSGYIWFEYTLTFYGEKDEVLTQKQVLAFWKLKKDGSLWLTHKLRQQEIL